MMIMKAGKKKAAQGYVRLTSNDYNSTNIKKQ